MGQVIGTPDYGKVPTADWGNQAGVKKRGQRTQEEIDREQRAMITGARPDMQSGYSFGNPTGDVNVGQFSNDPRIPYLDAPQGGSGGAGGAGAAPTVGPGYQETWGPAFAGAFLAPGAGEKQWEQQGQFYNTPQAGQNFTSGALGAAQEGMRTGGAAGQMFGDFQATAGQNNPGMEQYYANAARQGQEGIDRAAASRGAYGASSAMDASAEMNTNLAADRAKAEADYNLRRLSTGGQLAQSADSNKRGWFNSGTGAASQMDSNEMARVNAGMTAAGNAQQLGEDRTMGAFNILGTTDAAKTGRQQTQLDNVRTNDSGWSNALSSSDKALYDNLDAATQDLIDATLSGDKQGVEDAKQRGAKFSADANTIISAYSAFK